MKMKITALLFLLLSTALLNSCCIFYQDIPQMQIVEKYGKSEDGSRFLQIDDITLHYRDQGQGPALVALHGICDSLHTWDGWYEVLKNDFRFIRLDLPGFGLTGMAPPQYYNQDKYNMIMEKFLAALNVDDFALAGNSLGGYFSWKFALEHPGRVKKLILIDPAAYPLDPPWIVKIADSKLLSSLFYRITPRFLTKQVVKSVFGDSSKMTESDVDRFHEIMMMENNRRAYIDVFKQILKLSKESPEGISNLSMPVFLMWGSKDNWISPTQIQLWQEDLPSAQVIVYEGVGHTPQMEIPRQSAEDAREFIVDY
jgi:pimeloyl-ACP methyl ester carboxylesterase